MAIDVGKDFHHLLVNRHRYQGDGKHHAEDFRKRYLNSLDNENAWTKEFDVIVLDFSKVRKIGPSFANEAFAYFMKFVNPELFFTRVKFVNISNVQLAIIKQELETGYSR